MRFSSRLCYPTRMKASRDADEGRKIWHGGLRNVYRPLPFWAFVAAVLGAVTPDSMTATAGGLFRVAILHGTYSGGRHSDEFDGALRQLGWPSEKFSSTPADLERLASGLGRFDLVLGCPLFNFEPAQDMTPYVDRFRAFVRGGGAVALTDGNYPQGFNWLAQLDPDMAARTQSPCRADKPPIDVEPLHPLRSLPNRLHEGNMWAHLLLPERSRWEAVLRCGEGHPITVLKRFGKGFVYLTSLRQANAATLENLRACLELQRMDIKVTRFTMPELTVGAGEIQIGLTGLAEREVTVSLVLEIQPLPRRDETARTERNERFAVDLRLWPGAEVQTRLPYRINTRGPVDATLRLESTGLVATAFSRRMSFPDLLVLHTAMYRGWVSTARQLPEVSIRVDVTPNTEAIDDCALELSLVNAAGVSIGAVRRALDAERTRVPVPLPVDAPPGQYSVRGRLTRGRTMLAEATTAFSVLAPAPNQVVIDDDLSLLVDGKPFFPLGIYHVPTADLPAVAALGVNLVHVWDWDGVGAVDKALGLGLKVLWEMNHNSPDKIRKWAPKLKDHPALLVWYGKDEPDEAEFDAAKSLNDAYHDCDPTTRRLWFPARLGSSLSMRAWPTSWPWIRIPIPASL